MIMPLKASEVPTLKTFMYARLRLNLCKHRPARDEMERNFSEVFERCDALAERQCPRMLWT